MNQTSYVRYGVKLEEVLVYIYIYIYTLYIWEEPTKTEIFHY